MNYTIGDSMDDKVSVSIEQIQNGFLFRRSWCEKKKGKEDDMKYHHDEYFMETLPGPLKKLFDKGYMADMMSDDIWDKTKKEPLSDDEDE